MWAVADTVFPGNTSFDGNLSLTDESYIFQAGSGITIGGALTTAGGVHIGYNAIMPYDVGSLFAESGINQNYSILTGGNISIATVLEIASTNSLTIGGTGGARYNFNAAAIEAYGGLNLYGATLTIGQIVASGTGSAGNVTIQGNSLNVTSGVFQSLDARNVTVNLGGGTFNIASGSIENKSSGTMSITAGAINAQTITNDSNSGTLNINASSLNLTGGDASDVASFINKGNFVGNISGATTLAHGFDLSSMGATNSFSLTTGTLSLGDRIDAFFDNNLTSFTVNVTNGAINANTIRNGYSDSAAVMSLSASTFINADGVYAYGGTMNLSAPIISIGTGGLSVAEGGALNVSNAEAVVSDAAVAIYGNLSAGLTSAASGGMNIISGWTDIDAEDYTITVGGGISANGSGNGLGIFAQTVNVTNDVISSNGGGIAFYTGTVNIGGNLGGNNVAFYNSGTPNGMYITVGGDIIGGTDIIGLAHMTVGGDYIFDDASRLVAFANSGDAFTYWSTATFDEEHEVTTITNASGAEPLISVSGHLITDVNGDASAPNGTALLDSQIGINLNRMITETSTAIWLLHASEGIQELAARIAGLSINFCNSDGTICMDYFAAGGYNQTGDDLPIHLVSYDTDGDGVNDSLYVVFDDQFLPRGRLFKLQPIVASAPYYTIGEYQSAGALDDLIEHLLISKGFSYDSPAGVMRILFDNTVMSEVSEELYQRMMYYWTYNKPDVIRAFSRVFQLREANQIADMLELNTHTIFKDISNRFIDEAIWNRNRRLNKLWFVGDYGYFWDDLVDSHAHGSRINFNFGYDWQANNTLILGWMGHVGHARGEDNDVIDLTYGSTRATGYVDTDVRNLNVGGGAYFMKTLGIKARWYGDAMLDLNFIDVKRDQTWVNGRIEGDAFSLGLVGETGIIHDWLNQYVIGNVYLRLGYNSGFDMTEKVRGTDYMNLDFDGHFILTPGYSLTAQKRIYPSAWFQFRPYATVGVEYDLIKSPDQMHYRFAVVNPWREYDIGVDPLWAHAGAGIEFLSVNGVHVGLDYRYQYNANVQMHKLQLSGMYRF